MALFERENDEFRPDLRSQALSVIAIENDFVSVYSSTATSFAPSTWRIDGGTWPSKARSA